MSKHYYKAKRKRTHKVPYSIKMIILMIALTVLYIKTNEKRIILPDLTNLLHQDKTIYLLCGGAVLALIVLIIFIHKTYKKHKILKSGIYAIDKMSGVEFEEFLKVKFEKLGYKVSLTPTTGDYGVDLICKSSKGNVVIQAKRYRQKVGIAAVQEIIGGTFYYNCKNGMVVTNSYFTQAAKNLAKKSNIILWNRNDVINKLCC